MLVEGSEACSDHLVSMLARWLCNLVWWLECLGTCIYVEVRSTCVSTAAAGGRRPAPAAGVEFIGLMFMNIEIREHQDFRCS